MPATQATAKGEFDPNVARYELEVFFLSGQFDLYEDRSLIGTVYAGDAAAELSFGKLIFSCWSEEWSRSWRVIDLQFSPDSLRLECTRQMGRINVVLDLCRQRPGFPANRARRELAHLLRELIPTHLPGMQIRTVSIARDDSNHLSGIYPRFEISSGDETIAGIAVSNGESQTAVDAVLGAGLNWLADLRSNAPGISRLMVFAPQQRTCTLATRLTLLRSELCRAITLFEVDEESRLIRAVTGFNQGDLIDNLRRASKHALWAVDRPIHRGSSALIQSIVAAAPTVIDLNRSGGWISLSIKGLEFARVSARRPIAEFGYGDVRERLNADNPGELVQLVERIAAARVDHSIHRNEVLFRAQSERWLESVIKRDVTCLDPTLDSRYCYSQVPAFRGDQRSYIDLLGVTREGRLVVIELKVAEDQEFPFQALDYWLRVEWHRLRGDFVRRGYFAGTLHCFGSTQRPRSSRDRYRAGCRYSGMGLMRRGVKGSVFISWRGSTDCFG
jgi:hypothetical protein